MKVSNKEANKLVEDNLKLVGFVINKYFGKYLNDYNLLQDLKQEGYLALVKASRNYDNNISKFSTFAIYYIHGSIRQFIMKNSTIYIPRSMYYGDHESISVKLYLDSNIKDDSESTFNEFIKIEDDFTEYITEDLIDSFISTIKNNKDKDVMEEYYYSIVFYEKPNYKYMCEKYNISQPQYSRIIKKYNKMFIEFIKR